MHLSTTLDELGIKHGTDKSSRHHDYLRKIEPFVADWRRLPMTMLEIGVKRGASIRMWRDYFRMATIVGIDKNPDSMIADEGRIITLCMEAQKLKRRADLPPMKDFAPFRLIVDDGSHKWDHQLHAFEVLWPYLETDGIYIIEDLHGTEKLGGAKLFE